jgi:SAM-dependent methyltransferase
MIAQEMRAPDTPNYRYYESPGVAEFYASYKTTLFLGEAAVLHSLHKELKDQPLLELGVGAGRLTPYLCSISRDYVGLDYSAKMIAMCRKRFKKAHFVTCDARAMSNFKDGQFAAVIFGFNGIDEVTALDRMKILHECRRVLKSNGILFFSSHNLDWTEGIFRDSVLEGVSWRKCHRMLDMLRLRVFCWYLVSRLWSWFAHRGYAILPFYEWPSPRMVAPLYWIRKEAQEKQLLDAGFNQIRTVAVDGRPFDPVKRRRGFMLFYFARKN